MPSQFRLVCACVFVCLLAATVDAQSWHIRFEYPVFPPPDGQPAYWGFPFALRAPIPGGMLNITTVNGNMAPPASICVANNSYAGTGLDIYTVYQYGSQSSGYTTSISSDSGTGVGKVLYTYGALPFRDPTTGTQYPGAVYYDKQAIVACDGTICGTSGKWIAYTYDGINFVGNREVQGWPDWWCNNGFPCDSGIPRQWYTSGDFIPLIFGSQLYAIAFTLLYDLRPGQPYTSNPQIWTLSSTDGNTWTPYQQVNDSYVAPRYYQPGCNRDGPYFFNSDIAFDPASSKFYVTRSYSDSYAGCFVTQPDRVQIYSAYGAAGLLYGPWTLEMELSCAELGFQPDSAQILHDGSGNIIPASGGGLTLYISVSGNGWTYSGCQGSTSQPGACGVPPNWKMYEVVVGP